jgi:serine protease Do
MKSTFIIILSLCAGLCLAQGVRSEAPLDILHQISDAQAAVYERVGPSVVRIMTEQSSPEADEMDGQQSPFMNPELWEGTPFEFYFQTPQGQKRVVPSPHKMRPAPPDSKREPGNGNGFHVNGIGSGIIVRTDGSGGWVLTNNHVIGDAERVNIEFRDDPAINDFEVISDPKDPKRNTFLDKKSDLALIHLTTDAVGSRKLKAVPFGDSDALRVGQMVFTLGAPLNREQTFSQGIISAKDRGGVLPNPNENEIKYEGFLQTTAFINVGNSGGPLVNVDGEVVGIDVAIQTAGGFSNGFVGIGFAIPSNRAKQVVDALIQGGRVVRGYLGVKIRPPDVETAAYFNLPPKTGVAVDTVYPQTPADKGGIKKNDIILTFNGKEVLGTTHLQQLVADAQVSKAAKMEVLRGKEKLLLEVPIEEQPEETAPMVAKAEGEILELGATLRDPDEEESKYYGESNFKGVIVGEVNSNGPLGKKIPKGSLITAIEQTKVTSVDQLRETLEKIIASRSDKREVRVMVTYVPSSSDKTEEFQIIKLDLSKK